MKKWIICIILPSLILSCSCANVRTEQSALPVPPIDSSLLNTDDSTLDTSASESQTTPEVTGSEIDDSNPTASNDMPPPSRD